MVVGRALRATGCTSCRLSLLRTFSSINGPLIRLQSLPAALPRSLPPPRARYSSQLAQENGKQLDHVGLETQTSQEVDEEAEKTTEDSVEVSTIPWYLQVQTPQKAPQPLSDRQRIPDLPESPPPILEPLLQQISVDLGLDSLSLLDLRKLDPPPALGANLLMILGTARSEKHLHVSADRLCRWLRSTYKLRPDADGLLGRNELKLKLRRKSRRAKLMGSASDDTGDDGVRTGWVCVDIGIVDGPETVAYDTHSDFVGFGRRTDGVRIVVQMLTEEKRLEIDLEKLWRGILKRGSNIEKEGEENESIEPASQRERVGRIGTQTLTILSQTRSFHTSARYLLPQLEAKPYPLPPLQRPPSPQSGATQTEFHHLQELVTSLLGLADSSKIKESLRQYSSRTQQLSDGEWRSFVVQQLKIYLESIPSDRAMEALGQGFTDHSSTPFLTCFYHVLSDFPCQAEAEARIWLHTYAMDLGHKSYTSKNSMQLFNELRLFGVKISRESYLNLIRCVLRAENVADGLPTFELPSHQADEVMEIIQTMYDQGHDIITEDVLVELQELSAPTEQYEVFDKLVYKDSTTLDLPSLPMNGIQLRLHALIKLVDIPCFSDTSRLRLLALYSKHNNWREFWDIWNMAPVRGQHQSADIYTFMFFTVAATRNQTACMKVLRTWISDLDQEIPNIKLEGSVAEAVKACLRIADPFVEEEARVNPKARGEWITLWRRCV